MKGTPAATPKTAAVDNGKAPKPGSGAMPDSIKTKYAAMRGGNSQGGASFAGTGGGGSRKVRTAIVWVLEGKTPKPVPVKIGISDGANVEVIEGITANSNLVVGVSYKDAKQAANANSPTGPGMGRRF